VANQELTLAQRRDALVADAAKMKGVFVNTNDAYYTEKIDALSSTGQGGFNPPQKQLTPENLGMGSAVPSTMNLPGMASQRSQQMAANPQQA
jgi:hypothetical protein